MIDAKTLPLYIVAASFPKMNHRMRSPRLSQHYFDCLTGMELKDFGFTEPTHIGTVETNSENPDQALLDYLPGLARVTKIDNLLVAMTEGTEIYNKDTYLEFHNLLCELLRNFRQSLDNLITLSTEKNPIATNIRDQLKIVLSFGRSLRAVVTGAAIEKHLKAVADLLEVDNGNSWVVGDEEGDAEFDALKPYSTYRGKPLLPWQSYKNWLKLMIVYFDAESILRHHLSSHPRPNLDIQILAPCLPDQEAKMLTWKKLLLHKTYFPELPNDTGQPSAEDLITFLTSDHVVTDAKGKCNEAEEESSVKEGEGSELEEVRGVSIQEVIKSVKKIQKDQETAIAAKGVDMDGFTNELKKVDEKLSLLKGYSSSLGSAECFSTIVGHLQTLKLPDQTPKARLLLIRDLEEMLETLKARSALYFALKEGEPLSLGDGFSGTRHCEACLASFNSLSGRPSQDSELKRYDEILSAFAVSHIFMHYLNLCPILQCRVMDKL